MCVLNCSQDVCSNLPFLFSCLSVICSDEYECVCVCSAVQMSLGCFFARKKVTFVVQSGGEESQKADKAGVCSSQGVMLRLSKFWCCAGSTVQISTLNLHVCMFFVIWTVLPDLRWCHLQLLHGWQTASAPQHGALWFACQADWQVNDTNESQPSLPTRSQALTDSQ